MLERKKQKINVKLYISILITIFTLIIVFFVMYKYNVEGESIPPFKISKMVVVSSAKTENLQLQEETYSADIVQNNDIRIAIEKNSEYKKEAIINKVTLNNFQIDKKDTMGNIEIYRPSEGIKMYEYIPQYNVQDTIEYIGEQETYIKGEILRIANQGGIIDFSVILNNIGKVVYNENEALKVDGTLLKQIGIEKLEYKISFDLIIELESGIRLKSKITLDLPTGDILENGIETLEESDLKIVFKRI